MKTIGIIGGMSWESTEHYYRLINEETKKHLGALNSASIVMISVNFAGIEELQNKGEWQKAGELLAEKAKAIEAAGADFLLIATNTMHKVAAQVEAAITIPLLHIADATAASIFERGIKSIGLLGTRFTMEEDFYVGRLKDAGLEVIIPSIADREFVHKVIYEELCQGVLNQNSKKEYLRIMDDLTKRGGEGIILGCTEIGLLVKENDSTTILFDTTVIHAQEAVNLALKE
jgi:aspartate racemase